MLKGKKILVAVTGSIAAYKAALLVRLLVKEDVIVKVVMTPSAKDFITPLTLSTLSKNPVHIDISSEEGWHNHVELGMWSDAMIVAPATANTIAKMANGLCDNLLLAAYLSSRCPVFIAPAMDLDMWEHPANQQNCKKLQGYGNYLLPVEEGELASGLVGKGRMAEPENIVLQLESFFLNQQKNNSLANKTVIITSGPTVEAIDPVRFISNHSTGKMGAALADNLANLGANVIFVSGPSKVKPISNSIKIIDVQSAEEMYKATAEYFPNADIVILAAAVADYTPIDVASNKIKKTSEQMSVQLRKTKDIAATLGKQKQTNQIMVGFALETNNAFENAERKLKEKNMDFIVLNNLEDKGAGFAYDTNKVTFLDKNGLITRFDMKSKIDVAHDIIDKIITLLI